MSDLHAFKLRSDLDLDELQGASIAYGPLGLHFDIKDALIAGDGTIVTDDPILIGTLVGADALEAADVPPNPVLAAVPGGGVQAEAAQPVLYTPQAGLADQGLVPDVPAVHAEEPDTVEEAQDYAAPTATVTIPEDEADETANDSDDDQGKSW